MFLSSRRTQHDLALSEVAARDVFFYNGHAGPYYGFYLDAAGLAQVNYGEFATYDMVPDRQQLVMAQGCQTYSQYADFLYANPAKSEANLDVITTVNYSYGRGTMTVLRNLVQTDDAGRHEPVDFFRIIADLNSEWLNAYRDVFYGVMGIDGNPQLHPYVALDKLGDSCATSADCGDANAHRCLDPGDGVRQCAAVTLSELACPSGTMFRNVALGGTIKGGVCFQRELGPEVFGIKTGSAQATALLELVNSASLELLDDEIALDARAARNIVAYRDGLDGLTNTADDNPIDSLEELDSISWVGERAFGKLASYLAR
jgi:hypothetical protein